ncbi:MAG: DUF2339 domain-containing protein [Acidimicrobiales bacterium]
MEPERALAELTTRVADLEADLGLRVTALERRVAALTTAEAAASAAPPDMRPAAPDIAPLAAPDMTPDAGPSGPPMGITSTDVPKPPPPPTAGDAVVIGPPVGPSEAIAPPAAPARTPEERFELGVETVLRWVGIALVVLAAVFLVSTAIDRGWISPEMQLLGATAIGFGLLAGGAWLIDTRRNWGLALANGGAVVIIVCAGASYGWLELWRPTTGLVLVAIAAAVSVSVAMRLRLESVAVTSTAAMLIVPAWARIIADAPVLATGVWLGLFAVAAAVVGVERGWTIYRSVSTWAAALWVVGLAGFLSADDNSDHLVPGIILVAVVGLMLWLGPALANGLGLLRPTTAGPARSGDDLGPVETLRAFEHRLVLLIPLWAWSSVILFGGIDPGGTAGTVGLAMSAGFLVLALAAGPFSGRIADNLFTSHLLGASVLTTVAVVTWLGGSTVMVVLAAQALAVLVVSNLFSDTLLKVNAYVLAGMAWLVLGAEVAEAVDRAEIVLGDAVAQAVSLAALAAVAWLTERGQPRQVAEVLFGAVWLMVLAFLASLVVPVVDDEMWLVVGVALAALSLVAAYRLGLWVLVIGGIVSVATVAGSGYSIVAAAVDGTTVVGHLANLSVVVALGLATAYLWWTQRRFELARPLLVLAWIWSLGWIASVFLTELDGSVSQVAISVAWAIAASGAIVVAIRSNEQVVRYIGLATLAVVLIKLLTVDLAEVDTLWRVGLFLVIGLGLLRLGYVLPRLAERYGPETGGNGPSMPDTGAGLVQGQ